jgi:beta-phosphoglucomutase
MPLDIRAFIFDLDGVLTNTPLLHRESWLRLAHELGITFGWDQHMAMQGLTRRQSLEVFLNGQLVDDATAADLMQRKNIFFLELLQTITPAHQFPGVSDLITEARAAGISIALGSSSQNAPHVLEKLGLAPLFDVIGHGQTVTAGKPAPDIFLWAAQQLGVTPQQAVVFEDSVAGMQAAITGGFWRVGVGGQHGPGAHLALPSLESCRLPELLSRLEAIAQSEN